MLDTANNNDNIKKTSLLIPTLCFSSEEAVSSNIFFHEYDIAYVIVYLNFDPQGWNCAVW